MQGCSPKHGSHLQPPGGGEVGSRGSFLLGAGRREPSAGRRAGQKAFREGANQEQHLPPCAAVRDVPGSVELWHTQEPEFSHFGTTQNAIDAGLIASWAPKPTRLYLGNPLLAPRCRCCGICPSPATSRALGRGSPGTDPAGRSRARGPVPAPEQRRSRQVSALNHTSQCTI